jgi:hypothetical protein
VDLLLERGKVAAKLQQRAAGKNGKNVKASAREAASAKQPSTAGEEAGGLRGIRDEDLSKMSIEEVEAMLSKLTA